MTDLKLPIKNEALLTEALTHRSFLNENRTSQSHNERLEFLGDAVLELAVSQYLYQRFPNKPEGDLTAFRAALVRTTTLAAIADQLGLGHLLKLSKGEEVSGGRTNPSLLANTFEAVLGAIYLDSNFQTVYQFLDSHLFPHLDPIIKDRAFKDYKSLLQELVQAKGQASPEYEVVSESGPDHNKTFTVVVKVNQKVLASGSGRSKQTAQQKAAQSALEKYPHT